MMALHSLGVISLDLPVKAVIIAMGEIWGGGVGSYGRGVRIF